MSTADNAVPVRVGDVIELSVHGLTHDGEGIGRLEGFTVFLPGAVPGDRVEAKVISVKKTYGRALLERVLSPSTERVQPACATFDDCGACQLQHMDYAAQLAHKRQWIVDALSRIGKLENVKVHRTLPMDNPWRYRNKAQFPVAFTGREVIAGCYRQRSHDVIDVSDCHIQHPLNNRTLAVVKELAGKYGVPVYEEATGHGVLRHVLVRVGFHTGEGLVVLVTTDNPFPGKRALAEELMQRVPELVGVVQNINPKRTNVVLGEKTVSLAGRDYLEDKLGGLTFRISARSFYQVNPLQTEVLYNTALKYAGLTGSETVLDAYCGIGTISLFLAREARQVIGVEVIAAAIADAKQNAELNGIENARFIVGESEKVIPWLYKAQGVKADVIVVDPPRAGCDEKLLQTIADMAPSRVVYVSCNPSTLARDLAFLAQHSYAVKEVQPVDMFPHTSHVECVAKLERR